MKKIAIALIMLFTITPAYADVYVAVDENGNAVGGAIVCDFATCGDPNSAYAKATLQPGQRYVLQGTGSVGIGNNNPNTTVKVDPQTNIWSVTHTDEKQKPISVETFATIEQRPVATNTNVIPTSVVETKTATDSTTATITDTATVVAQTISTPTFNYDEFMQMFLAWFKSWFNAFWLDWLSK